MHVMETAGENAQKPSIQSTKTVRNYDPDDLAIESPEEMRERIGRETAAEELNKQRRKKK